MRTRIRAWWMYEARPRLERIPTWVAWHLPRSIVYYAAIRLWVSATSTGPNANKHPDEVRMSQALTAWRR